MTTIMQKRAMENIASGNYKTYKDAMIEAGYSSETAKHPGTKLVDSKAVQAIIDSKCQSLDMKLDGILETCLENCRKAVVEGDRDAESAWKSEFSAKLLKIFEKHTQQLIQKQSQSEDEINQEEIESLVIDYLLHSPPEQRTRIISEVQDQLTGSVSNE